MTTAMASPAAALVLSAAAASPVLMSVVATTTAPTVAPPLPTLVPCSPPMIAPLAHDHPAGEFNRAIHAAPDSVLTAKHEWSCNTVIAFRRRCALLLTLLCAYVRITVTCTWTTQSTIHGCLRVYRRGTGKRTTWNTLPCSV
jgi:hypothetical protein